MPLMVPTMLKMLMDHPDFHEHDLSNIEVITYGAAPMPLEVIQRAIREFPGTHFINAFGQTETASTITMLPPEDHILEGSDEEIARKQRRLSSIGKPLEDVEVLIVDEQGVAVDTGDVGEIVARGSRLMKGYWNLAEATAETIRDGWLYTGDLGYFDEDGYIFLAGRAKDFIKRGGEMISPEELEQVLHSHPAIDEAAVIGVPDADWGERVRAHRGAEKGPFRKRKRGHRALPPKPRQLQETGIRRLCLRAAAQSPGKGAQASAQGAVFAAYRASDVRDSPPQGDPAEGGQPIRCGRTRCRDATPRESRLSRRPVDYSRGWRL